MARYILVVGAGAVVVDVLVLELDELIQSKMLRVETPGGMLWSCLDCGYVAKKANIIEHIDAKGGYHNYY